MKIPIKFGCPTGLFRYFFAFRYTLLVAFLLLCVQSCGSFELSPHTQEQWYPNYSHFRVIQPSVIVFIHGYAGWEDTFAFVPYLASRFPGRTIMYFNYETDFLRGRLYSFGVIAQDLRTFLQNNVFYRGAPDRTVDIVCHSTGCPIARQYVANNPFDHRIGKILMVGGANYGAYYAETHSVVKEFISKLPFLEFFLRTHGDKQIQELKNGSFSLFYLQQRWHHLLVKSLMKVEKGKVPKESWLENTPFRDFVHVVSADEDSQERYKKERIRLPQIMAVVGTNGWHESGMRKFSDGVIRVESALPDCRFLSEAPKAVTTPHPGENCRGRLLAFLPCFHTELFSDSRCRDEILDIVQAFLTPAGTEKLSQDEAMKKVFEKQMSDPVVKDYVDKLDTSALWIRVLDRDLVDRPESYPVEKWEESVEKANTRIQVKLLGEERNPPGWLVGLYDNDILQAVRSSKVAPERIFYYKYLQTLKTGKDIKFQILIDNTPAKIITPTQTNASDEGGPYRLFPGQTLMVNCEHKSNATFFCEELTSYADVPMQHVKGP